MDRTNWKFRNAKSEDIPELFDLINKAYEVETGDVLHF